MGAVQKSKSALALHSMHRVSKATSSRSSGTGTGKDGEDGQMVTQTVTTEGSLWRRSGRSGMPSVIKRISQKGLAVNRVAAAFAALGLNTKVVLSEMGDVMEHTKNVSIGGKSLEALIQQLAILKKQIAADIEVLKLSEKEKAAAAAAAAAAAEERAEVKEGNGDEESLAEASEMSSWAPHASPLMTFLENIRGQMDDIEAMLYTELKPKLIGTDDDGSGQLVLGGHVVAQVLSGSAALDVLSAAASAAPAAPHVPSASAASPSTAPRSAPAYAAPASLAISSAPPFNQSTKRTLQVSFREDGEEDLAA